MNRTCILILGMHRSGTSSIAGLLHHIGIPMGKIFTKPILENPKGYFEDKPLVMLNHGIYQILNTDMYDTSLIDIQRFSNIDPRFKELAIAILYNEYENHKTFGIKDPNMCVLFPFWENIFIEKNIDMRVIIPYRNPLEIAYSLHLRASLPILMGLTLWTKYMLLAEYYTKKYNRVFINYNNLINSTSKELQNIKDTLNIDIDIDFDDKTNFIEKSLKHFDFSLDHLAYKLSEITINEQWGIHDISLGFILEMAMLLEELSLTNKYDYIKEEKFKAFMNQYIKLIKSKSFSIYKDNCKSLNFRIMQEEFFFKYKAIPIIQ